MTLIQIERKAKRDADLLVGGLSKASKMPGPSFSISAFDCQTGSKLAKIPGSVCSDCYARKGHYHYPNVKAAHARRLEALGDSAWVASMITLVKGVKHFRWHDSGDVQSVAHLKQIVEVCKGTPETMHWLPSKEYAYVKAYLKTYGAFPSNLCVRLSAHMVDAKAPKGFPNTSTVSSTHATDVAVQCPAPTQGNQCKDCRACWDRSVPNVNYWKH